MNKPQYPTLHKPVPMGSRVRLPDEWLGKPATGRVVGIASIHVVFQYIVLLDYPVDTIYGRQDAVVCGGPQLSSFDSDEHWRFTSDEDRDQYLKKVNTL